MSIEFIPVEKTGKVYIAAVRPNEAFTDGCNVYIMSSEERDGRRLALRVATLDHSTGLGGLYPFARSETVLPINLEIREVR